MSHFLIKNLSVMNKNYLFICLFCLFAITQISCTNDENQVGNGTESCSIENKDEILDELIQFTEYTLDGAIQFYDRSNDFLDLDKLDAYIFKFDFSNNVQSRSVSEDYHFVNCKDMVKDMLSAEAYNLLLSYLSSPEEISLESLDKLKDEFSRFSDEDRKIFDLIYSATNVIYSEFVTFFDGINTRAVKNPVACSITMTLAGSAAGWIWGVALGGGPVGLAVGVAWEVAMAVASQYTC